MTPDTTKCPICGYANPHYTEDSTRSYKFNCSRCGTFIISYEMMTYRDKLETLHTNADKLSGLTRLLAETGGTPIKFLTTTIGQILEDSLIPERTDILKKAELLLTAIKRKTNIFGTIVELQGDTDFPLAFAANYQELRAILELLENAGDILISTEDNTDIYVKITAKGWLNIQKGSTLNQGFIAAWFDDKNRTMDVAIAKTEAAIKKCGFSPKCIRGEHYSETILEKAIGEIKNSRFVIVNLTGDRNSVYFEAGFATGLGKEVIYVADKTITAGSFYPKQYKIYYYSDVDELESMLVDAIRARIS